jgi:hypothetical protein
MSRATPKRSRRQSQAARNVTKPTGSANKHGKGRTAAVLEINSGKASKASGTPPTSRATKAKQTASHLKAKARASVSAEGKPRAAAQSTPRGAATVRTADADGNKGIITLSRSAFAQKLGRGNDAGEQLAIHRRPYVRKKPVPRRPSMLDPYAAEIDAWLTVEPHLTGAEVLKRLGERACATFERSQLRTVQRLIMAWRRKEARQLIDTTERALAPHTSDFGSSDGHVQPARSLLGNNVT